MKKFIASSIFALLIPSQAFSATVNGHVNNATITGLYCGFEGSYNMCSVLFNKTIEDADPCNTIPANRMQFRGDTNMGKAILAVALTAYTTKNLVTIHSTGLCDVYKGLSDVNYIELL